MKMFVFEANNLVKDCFDLLVKKGYEGIRKGTFETVSDDRIFGVHMIDNLEEMDVWMLDLQQCTSIEEIENHFSKASNSVQLGCLSYLFRNIIMKLQDRKHTETIDFPKDLLSVFKLAFSNNSNALFSRIL